MSDNSGEKRSGGAESTSRAVKRPRTEPLQDDDLCVNWGVLGEGRRGQRKPLSETMSLERIDEAVGWAAYVECARGSIFSPPNPLACLESTPMRPSLLGFINDRAAKLLIDTEQNNVWETFDNSALVALGMVWEEMLTATLVPFAEEHVKRCRRLMVDASNVAFEDWTLPPDEAILKISRFAPRTFSGGLPTASLLAKTCRTEEASLVEYAELWCKSHGASLKAAQKAWHIYKLFLPNEYAKVGQVLNQSHDVPAVPQMTNIGDDCAKES